MTAQHAAAVAEAGGLVGAWPCGITSRSLADFGTEIIRLAEAAGPDHVAIGTDLDGNYRPVLTSYDQLDDLTGLLAARGLPTARVHQILGGNAHGIPGPRALTAGRSLRICCTPDGGVHRSIRAVAVVH